MSRVKSLQIYMKPGVEEDDLMLRIWDECRRRDRPQDVFRRMLRAGMRSMVENGEMPQAIVDSLNLGRYLEDSRKARRETATSPAAYLYPYPPPHPYLMPPAAGRGASSSGFPDAPSHPVPKHPAESKQDSEERAKAAAPAETEKDGGTGIDSSDAPLTKSGSNQSGAGTKGKRASIKNLM